MKHSESEIIKALNVIKDVCRENNCNGKCPFSDYTNYCNIAAFKPMAWDIVEYKEVFKAFNE